MGSGSAVEPEPQGKNHNHTHGTAISPVFGISRKYTSYLTFRGIVPGKRVPRKVMSPAIQWLQKWRPGIFTWNFGSLSELIRFFFSHNFAFFPWKIAFFLYLVKINSKYMTHLILSNDLKRVIGHSTDTESQLWLVEADSTQ